MQITPRVAVEVAAHEAVVREAYRDSVGVWTWSVGLTNATGHRVERYIGNPQSLEHCLAVYAWALENYAEAVRAEFHGHDLTEAQFAAALSFHWNTGAIRSASWPDHWRAGEVGRAKQSFLSWNKAGGVYSAGVAARRGGEVDLFFDGKWSSRNELVEWTRVRPNGSIDWTQRRVHERAEAIMREAMGLGDAPADPQTPAGGNAINQETDDMPLTDESGNLLPGPDGLTQVDLRDMAIATRSGLRRAFMDLAEVQATVENLTVQVKSVEADLRTATLENERLIEGLQS